MFNENHLFNKKIMKAALIIMNVYNLLLLLIIITCNGYHNHNHNHKYRYRYRNLIYSTSSHISINTNSKSSSPSSPIVTTTSSFIDTDHVDKNKRYKGHPHNDDSRKKISEANKGKVPWNAGKKHSEETIARIKEKTREAMIKRKTAEAIALGYNTLEEYEDEKQRQKEMQKALKPKRELTEEGRKRISESLKKRWSDPEYRKSYSTIHSGKRNHSESTRARISEAIKAKWQDETYRNKVCLHVPSPEIRAKISASLKAKWQDEDFRLKMKNNTFQRTEEWKQLLSEKMRLKWNESDYRIAVSSGLKASFSNRTRTELDENGQPVVRLKKSKTKTKDSELRKEQLLAVKADRKEREVARRLAIKEAKAKTKAESNQKNRRSLKDLLGGEFWFEEKMKRSNKGQLLDDDDLEKQLEAEEDGDYDELDDVNDVSFDDWSGFDSDRSQDIIEVYDEDGGLIATYTEAEYAALQSVKQ